MCDVQWIVILISGPGLTLSLRYSLNLSKVKKLNHKMSETIKENLQTKFEFGFNPGIS